MPWLVRDGEVLASLEIAEGRADRRRGLLGRDDLDGALLLRPARTVHTLFMRFPIDVAYCDDDLVVIDRVTMPCHRIGLPRLRSHAVVEAPAGAFNSWELRVGDQLEIKS